MQNLKYFSTFVVLCFSFLPCICSFHTLRSSLCFRVSRQGRRLLSGGKEGLESQLQREQFPIFRNSLPSGGPLLYLDSGATSQKPKIVLDSMNEHYEHWNANVHRGAYFLSDQATAKFEQARETVQQFINAPLSKNVILTKGATEAINIVALSFGSRLQKGDDIVITEMEHHANIVPWQMLAQRTGARLRIVSLTESGELDMNHFHSLLSSKTRIVACTHVSNVLGVVNPVEDIVHSSHAVGAVVLLDASQSVPHLAVDVQALGVDFLVASGHKMCGPTGIGFLYGRTELLDSMPPVYGGGEMVQRVDLQQTTFASPPLRFEAGTPPIAEAIGLGAACKYLNSIGMSEVETHGRELGKYLYSRLQKEFPSVQLLGPNPETAPRIGLVSFNIPPHDPAQVCALLDKEGVAVRGGTHCAQPLHRTLGISGSVRVSTHIYDGTDQVDEFIRRLHAVVNCLNDPERTESLMEQPNDRRRCG